MTNGHWSRAPMIGWWLPGPLWQTCDKHALSNPLLLRHQEWCFISWCRLCLLRQRASVIMSFLVSVCSGMNLSTDCAPTNGANKSHVTKWALALVSLLQNEEKSHYHKTSWLHIMCLVVFPYSVYPTRERSGSKCIRVSQNARRVSSFQEQNKTETVSKILAKNDIK